MAATSIHAAVNSFWVKALVWCRMGRGVHVWVKAAHLEVDIEVYMLTGL